MVSAVLATVNVKEEEDLDEDEGTLDQTMNLKITTTKRVTDLAFVRVMWTGLGSVGDEGNGCRAHLSAAA